MVQKLPHEEQTASRRPGSFNGTVSHRVRVEEIGQVDKELLAWLREAYNAS